MLAEMNEESTGRIVLRVIAGVTGVVVALFSLLVMAIGIAEMAAGGDGETSTGVYIFLLLFFAGTTAIGAYLAWKGFRIRTPRRGQLEREQRILALAQVNEGRVTIAEVAALCGLSVDQSKAELDRMQRGGITDVQLSDTGVLIYTFPGLEPDVIGSGEQT